MRRALAPYLLMALFGLLICCTRTSEVKTSEKTAFQQELKGRERDRSTEVVQTGPETITTTVEEWEAPGPLSPDGSSPRASAVYELDGIEKHATGGLTAPAHPEHPTLPAAPILVKRTVTVDRRGPVVATKTEVATKVETASLTEKQEKASDTKKKTSYWPPWWLWACGAALLGLGGWALKRGVKIASL